MNVDVQEVVMLELQGVEEITVGRLEQTARRARGRRRNLAGGAHGQGEGEIPSPVTGTIAELLLDVGDPVKPGQAIARIAPE